MYKYIILLQHIFQQCKSSIAIYLQALHAANVGNTGFIIIRHGSIFKISNTMFHEFSFPIHIVKGDDHSEIIEVCNLSGNIFSFSPDMRNNWKIICFLSPIDMSFWVYFIWTLRLKIIEVAWRILEY
jgi:hypothetical protein